MFRTVFFKLSRILLPAAFALSSSLAHAGIGFRETMLAPATGTRALHVAIWYPTAATGPRVRIAANANFPGTQVIREAPPVPESHPLVVLSHGYGGTWRNLAWLAVALARQDYVVAAPDHPGTTIGDMDPAAAAQLWQRPHDLSRVIDALTANAALAGPIAPGRIAAIGHSLGGWTVAALIGARFDAARFLTRCRSHRDPRICKLAGKLGIAAAARQPASRLDGDLHDSRVRAAVTLDIGLARGFTPQSLHAIEVPVLVIGAGVDIGDLPVEMESGYLAANLRKDNRSYTVIPGATHFSFVQLCRPGAITRLDARSPGLGVICKDGYGRSRAAIHAKVATMVADFLTRTIPSR